MVEPDEQLSRQSDKEWPVLGRRIPKTEVVFFSQVLIVYTVIVVSIYNLTKGGGNSNLWTSLLSSCLGYLLPNPSIKRRDAI